MTPITTLDALHALYDGPVVEAALRKVANRLTPLYAKWILASRFCVLSTVGPEGTDGTPRGDVGPVVEMLDDRTLAMPDWQGNNRLDALRNIVRDGRVSLMFMVPGSTTVVRVNGVAIVTADADLVARFERKGMHPRSVIVIEVGEVYTQCAKALLRSGLWTSGDQSGGLPSPGDILTEVTQGELSSGPHDAAWRERTEKAMW